MSIVSNITTDSTMFGTLLEDEVFESYDANARLMQPTVTAMKGDDVRKIVRACGGQRQNMDAGFHEEKKLK